MNEKIEKLVKDGYHVNIWFASGISSFCVAIVKSSEHLYEEDGWTGSHVDSVEKAFDMAYAVYTKDKNE